MGKWECIRGVDPPCCHSPFPGGTHGPICSMQPPRLPTQTYDMSQATQRVSRGVTPGRMMTLLLMLYILMLVATGEGGRG
jgi:hypothetical protein